MEKYLLPLVESFRAAENPERAYWSKRYLKDQFEFIGLDAKQLRMLLREFFTEFGYPEIQYMESFCRYLWELPEREYQAAGVEVLRKMAKKLEKEDIKWIEKLITTKSWWDTVDGLAVWVVGNYFRKYPDQIIPVTSRWMDTGNMWLQRVCLIFQLQYKEKTDTILLARYIERLASHKDFFIRKAIGWALRQYSKTDPDWVRAFIDSHPLSGLSVREGRKYL